MEAFAVLKFWKTSNAKIAAGTTAVDGDGGGTDTISDSTVSDHLTEESDDDDESFFELEFTLPNYESRTPQNHVYLKNIEQEREIELKSTSKPQSPVSVLRSAAPNKLKVFMLGKLKPKSKKDDQFEMERVSSVCSPKRNSSSLFTVKFQIEDGSIVPKLSRSNSSSLSSPKIQRQSSEDCHESSKRFSKDVVQKYLNLITPRYVKSSKRYTDKEKFVPSPAFSPTRSTSSFPSPREEKQSSRFKVKCKQLGKSKSASSVIGASSTAPVSFPARNDHCHDGIEGAILHCKRSLNSSKTKGHSSLSRCSSDPSHEKSVKVSQ